MQANILTSVMTQAVEHTPITEVLLYVLIPMAAIVAGGILASFMIPGPVFTSTVQHFAAGVVFFAVAVELLPKMLHEKEPIAIIIGFTVGVVLMLIIKKFAEGAEGIEEGTKQPTSLLITVAIDVSIDGLLVGLGFAAGGREGVLLTVALGIEIFFLGLATSSALSRAKVSRQKAILLHLGLSLLIGIGGVLGATLLGGLSGAVLEVFLAFGVAALMFLVTEELLVEAHKEHDTIFGTAMFFVGFMLFLLISLVSS
ncbi:transporter [Candidatus Chlorohelix sp.]|uniref:ZIP family metal transporter n=1 Tax=Candidatus Chlorohelix sp. TaxID=3139201 RepID=UPI003033AE9E